MGVWRHVLHRGCVSPRCRGRRAHLRSMPDGNATTQILRTSALCAFGLRRRVVRPVRWKTRRWRCGRHSRETRRCAKRCSASLAAGDVGRRASEASDRRCGVRQESCSVPSARIAADVVNQGNDAHLRLLPVDSRRLVAETPAAVGSNDRSSK